MQQTKHPLGRPAAFAGASRARRAARVVRSPWLVAPVLALATWPFATLASFIGLDASWQAGLELRSWRGAPA